MTQRYVKLLIGKNESIYSHFSTHHPALVKDEYFRPNEQAVIEIPQAAPEGIGWEVECPMDDPDSGWSEEDTLYFFPEDVVEVDKDGNPVTQ